jgi:hypothetical protein
MLTGQRWLIASLVAVASQVAAGVAGAAPENEPAPLPEARFVQTGTIDLQVKDRPAQINTFCLDPQGRLLVAVGGTQITTRLTSLGREVDKEEIAGEIRVFSQDGELLETWPLKFVPQALNVGPEGDVFVAGVGTVARLDRQGRVTKSGATPQIGNREEFEAAVQVQLDEMNRQNSRRFEDQIERIEELIERLEEKPEEDRTQTDKLRLQTSQRQLELLKNQSEQFSSSITLAAYVNHKLKVPGLAVTEKDVFLAVSATKGYGYDIWRLDHNFENPTQICSGLRGCCGQMDIQASGDELYVAENSRHRVCRYDRDGKEISSWGKSDRTGENGFEGCCNPMNLRFTPTGDVLTAESGVGLIKRFSPTGEFLGVVGKAALQGGCKHVAISATPDGSHLYMLDITRQRIAVLSPAAESESDADDTRVSAVPQRDADADTPSTRKIGLLEAAFRTLLTGSSADGK